MVCEGWRGGVVEGKFVGGAGERGVDRFVVCGDLEEGDSDATDGVMGEKRGEEGRAQGTSYEEAVERRRGKRVREVEMEELRDEEMEG